MCQTNITIVTSHRSPCILGLGPIQTSLRAFLSFLCKTEMKANTKITVIMCFHIVDRNSVAEIFGSDQGQGRLVDKIRYFKEKKCRKKIYTSFPRPQHDFLCVGWEQLPPATSQQQRGVGCLYCVTSLMYYPIL